MKWKKKTERNRRRERKYACGAVAQPTKQTKIRANYKDAPWLLLNFSLNLTATCNFQMDTPFIFDAHILCIICHSHAVPYFEYPIQRGSPVGFMFEQRKRIVFERSAMPYSLCC